MKTNNLGFGGAEKFILQVSLLIMIFLQFSVLSAMAEAETIRGAFVSYKNDMLTIRLKGSTQKFSVHVSEKAYVRNIEKGVADLNMLPKNSRLYVTIENNEATSVTIEEVPR